MPFCPSLARNARRKVCLPLAYLWKWPPPYSFLGSAPPPLVSSDMEVLHPARPPLFVSSNTTLHFHHLHLHSFRATRRFCTFTTPTATLLLPGNAEVLHLHHPPTLVSSNAEVLHPPPPPPPLLHSFRATRSFCALHLCSEVLGSTTTATTYTSTRFEPRGGSAFTTTTT